MEEPQNRNLMGFGIIVLLWITNITLLSVYIAVQESNALVITALAGVIATGVVPMLGKNDIFWLRSLHVVSGVVGSAGCGLALGDAYQCGKSFDNNGLLLAAALVNIASGTYSHYVFISKSQREELYTDHSWAYELLDRGVWYMLILACSFIALLGHVMSSNCGSNEWLYFASPIIHVVVYALMIWSGWLEYLNLFVNNAAAVISTFGIALADYVTLDWFIVVPLYLYLALAHLRD